MRFFFKNFLTGGVLLIKFDIFDVTSDVTLKRKPLLLTFGDRHEVMLKISNKKRKKCSWASTMEQFNENKFLSSFSTLESRAWLLP